VVVLWGLTVNPPVAPAGVPSRLARETAEFLLKRFGREAGEESAEFAARRVERLLVAYGDDAAVAVRRVGPSTFRLVEEAGKHAPAAIKLMARRGDEAVWIVSRPKALAIFVRHGDDAATALLRHRTIAESLLTRYEAPALRALKGITPQNGRRLQMLAEEGLLDRAGRAPEILGVIGQHGDRALEFVWNHRAVLAGGAALTVFLANPRPFLDGAAHLVEATGTVAMSPIVETGRTFARSWSAFALAALPTAGLALFLVSRFRRQTGPAASPFGEDRKS
jgi:hypothetical protein